MECQRPLGKLILWQNDAVFAFPRPTLVHSRYQLHNLQPLQFPTVCGSFFCSRSQVFRTSLDTPIPGRTSFLAICTLPRSSTTKLTAIGQAAPSIHTTTCKFASLHDPAHSGANPSCARPKIQGRRLRVQGVRCSSMRETAGMTN